MQEEVTQKTVALVIKAAKLDVNVLKAAMRMYLEEKRRARQHSQGPHGKMSVKKLVGEGAGVSSIEISDENIKAFERCARKYNVDFAVKKEVTVEKKNGTAGKEAEKTKQAAEKAEETVRKAEESVRKAEETVRKTKYIVFFKGKDADVISQAFKEFVYENEKRKKRVSVREKLKGFMEKVAADKNRERSREKNKDRGQSL